MYLVYVHWNKIYSLSFLCDVCNQVHEHMQWLGELWWDCNTMMTSLWTYILNIIICGIFEKDIELSRKNNTI